MRETNESHETVLRTLRMRYWRALPTRAYRIRRLVRSLRDESLQPGEREELELTVQRLADSGATYGFREVSRIAGDILDELTDTRRTGQVDFDLIDASCDELDCFIDDMSFDGLAVRLVLPG